jgi:hypothetical protein
LGDGRLLFGGSRGLLVGEPESFEPAREAPPLVLTALRVARSTRPAVCAREVSRATTRNSSPPQRTM